MKPFYLCLLTLQINFLSAQELLSFTPAKVNFVLMCLAIWGYITQPCNSAATPWAGSCAKQRSHRGEQAVPQPDLLVASAMARKAAGRKPGHDREKTSTHWFVLAPHLRLLPQAGGKGKDVHGGWELLRPTQVQASHKLICKCLNLQTHRQGEDKLRCVTCLPDNLEVFQPCNPLPSAFFVSSSQDSEAQG